ncbi:hypothetical protein BGW80DRAFT_1443772 [Lactifluus volemus]|nr:hypothetical protein BGW80DRAFT_1443772 [Lactifluus volemus]
MAPEVSFHQLSRVVASAPEGFFVYKRQFDLRVTGGANSIRVWGARIQSDIASVVLYDKRTEKENELIEAYTSTSHGQPVGDRTFHFFVSGSGQFPVKPLVMLGSPSKGGYEALGTYKNLMMLDKYIAGHHMHHSSQVVNSLPKQEMSALLRCSRMVTCPTWVWAPEFDECRCRCQPSDDRWSLIMDSKPLIAQPPGDPRERNLM